MPVIDLEMAAQRALGVGSTAHANAGSTVQRPSHSESLYPHLIRNRLRVNDAPRPATLASAIYPHLAKEAKK
jgi:hypothetical protein